MKDTKFTPGNWQVEPVEASSKPRGLVYLRINSGKSIAFAGVYKDKGIDEAEARANAALIAAGPELYEELEIMRDWLAEQLGEWLHVRAEHYPSNYLVERKEHYDKLDFVLAKARGEMTAQQILEREG